MLACICHLTPAGTFTAHILTRINDRLACEDGQMRIFELSMPSCLYAMEFDTCAKENGHLSRCKPIFPFLHAILLPLPIC